MHCAGVGLRDGDLRKNVVIDHLNGDVSWMQTNSETSELRRTGINALGNLPWGSHFCHFYETSQDLLDILVPYFKAGLEDNEFCLWVISQPLRATEATKALREAVPDLERHLARRSLEILILPE